MWRLHGSLRLDDAGGDHKVELPPDKGRLEHPVCVKIAYSVSHFVLRSPLGRFPRWLDGERRRLRFAERDELAGARVALGGKLV